MTGRTHDLAAVTTLILYVTLQPIVPMSLATALTAVCLNQVGSAVPDLDQPTAGFWRRIPAGSIFGRIVSPLLGHHRMISHSLAGLALAGWGMKFVLDYAHTFLLVDMNVVWWAFMFGFASHLVMDTITKEGVPWLFPIPVRFGFPPVKLLRVRTGNLAEAILVFPALLILNGYAIYSEYGKWISFVTHAIRK